MKGVTEIKRETEEYYEELLRPGTRLRRQRQFYKKKKSIKTLIFASLVTLFSITAALITTTKTAHLNYNDTSSSVVSLTTKIPETKEGEHELLVGAYCTVSYEYKIFGFIPYKTEKQECVAIEKTNFTKADSEEETNIVSELEIPNKYKGCKINFKTKIL
ncbi:hypothetical protein M2146_001105 [Lachnospiraceae bacterium PF1-22]